VLSEGGRLWGLLQISLHSVFDIEVSAFGQTEFDRNSPPGFERKRGESEVRKRYYGSSLRYAMIMESFLAIASSATARVRSTVRRAEFFRWPGRYGASRRT